MNKLAFCLCILWHQLSFFQASDKSWFAWNAQSLSRHYGFGWTKEEAVKDYIFNDREA